jgi:hypothetical protein
MSTTNITSTEELRHQSLEINLHPQRNYLAFGIYALNVYNKNMPNTENNVPAFSKAK